MRGFRAAVGFMTSIPVTVGEGDYERFIARVHLFVAVGLLAGLLIGAAGLVLQALLPAPLAALLTIGCILGLAGINHVDGLSDTADGLVTPGPPGKKIASMKDVHAGAGGVLAIGLDLLSLYALLSTFAGSGLPLLFPLLAAEACAKVAMTTVIAFGKSAGPGMGAIAIAAAKKEDYYGGVLLAGAIVLIAAAITGSWTGDGLSWRFWAAVAAAMLSPLVVARALMAAADRNFGGVNGDVMGAANEIGRIAALAAMGAVLWMRW